jgi:uncharacterized protein with HEPN domain
LIHAYDAVDASMVWAIIKNHLDPLKEEAKKKIGKSFLDDSENRP